MFETRNNSGLLSEQASLCLDGCRCCLVQCPRDATALHSRDQLAQKELWQLLLVQASGQTARVKMERERASFSPWPKWGTERPRSGATKVWEDLGDCRDCAME